MIGQDSAPGSFGQDHVEARRPLPSRRWRQRPGTLLRSGRPVLPSLLIMLGVGQLVLLGVGVLDIADRALGLADVVGDAFIALGADADRPFDRRCWRRPCDFQSALTFDR